jgi:hypothetical protein
MLWILKMLLETPRAVIEYRRDYYKQRKIAKRIKQEGLVGGFYLHDELYGAEPEEWMILCEHITDNGKEVPQGLIDMALDKGWIAMKPELSPVDTDGPQETWREWENAS